MHRSLGYSSLYLNGFLLQSDRSKEVHAIETARWDLGGVYMIPARLSFRYEFTPVAVLERDFHSGTKTHSDVM